MKRTISSAICIVAMTYASLAVVWAQDVQLPHPSKLRATWTHSGLGTNGLPVEIAYFLLAASAMDVDLRTDGEGIAADLVPIDECVMADGSYESNLGPLFEGVDVTEAQVWVAAIGANGAVGPWSDPVSIAIDNTVPDAPVLEIRRTRPILLRR